jgi:hypothetical protein
MFEKTCGAGSHRPGSLEPGNFSTLPLQCISYIQLSNERCCVHKPTSLVGICQLASMLIKYATQISPGSEPFTVFAGRKIGHKPVYAVMGLTSL